MRKLLIAAFAVAAAFAVVLAMMPSDTVEAKKPAMENGNGAPSGSHYTLNIIGVPKAKTAAMDGSKRHTIFVPLSGKCKIELIVGDFQVTDGNCFDGDGAEFRLPNPDVGSTGSTTYSVFARALGTPGGTADMKTCAFDPVAEIVVCSLIQLELTRDPGQTQFKNASKFLLYIYVDLGSGVERIALFDPALEDYFWEYDNSGLKVAQLRFYECSTVVPLPGNRDDPQEDSDCFA